MNKLREVNNTDLIIFRAYLSDLKAEKNITTYRLLKECNLPHSYLYDLNRYLRGEDVFRKSIKLSLLIHISLIWDYPIDLSKYMYLIEPCSNIEDKQAV